MRNLAGDEHADKCILNELVRSRIEPVHGGIQPGEVAASITGRLGEYRFRRAWRYWVVEGLVPIEVARELYADPVGVTDIRVSGHCGCPSPDDQAIWFDKDGTRLLGMNQKAEADQYAQSKSEELRRVAWRILAENRFVEDPSAVGRGFIDLYHIDSEVGLRLFLDTIKRYQATAEAASDNVGQPVSILCTNWRGETAVRRVLPLRLRFASTEWHPGEQWLMDAIDIEKNAERSFAVTGIREWGFAPVGEVTS